MYTAAVTTQAADPGHARDLIDLLSSADQVNLRKRAGFLDTKN